MKKTQTFEGAMARLAEIVELLDRSELPLNESLKLFGEGAELIAYCNKSLGDAKLKLETLFPEQPEVENAGG